MRIRPVPKILLATLPISAMLLIFFGIRELATIQEVPASSSSVTDVILNFLFSPIMIAASIVTFWKVRRDRKLLRDGELAVGIVTHQELVKGRTTNSRVRYRFNDASGQLYQGKGWDRSFKLKPAMSVIVFYDSKHPGKNILTSTAICELRTN